MKPLSMFAEAEADGVRGKPMLIVMRGTDPTKDTLINRLYFCTLLR